MGSFIKLALEENPFIDFIITSLTEDPTGFISNGELLDLLDEHFQANALQPLVSNGRKRAPSVILYLLQTICGCDVRNVREKNLRGIRGVRRLDTDTDQPIATKKVESINLDVDPFTYERIIPYHELEVEFKVQQNQRNGKWPVGPPKK